MKNFIVAIILCFPVLAKAQWTISGSNIYNSNSGNVGINTSTLGAKLTVWGTALFGDAGYSNIDPNGNLGNLSFLANSSRVLIGWNRTGGGGETDFISNQGAGSPGGFAFYNYSNSNTQTQLLWIRGDGNVGIGTADPGSYRLAVNGSLHAKQVNIDMNGWADHVFKKQYNLRSLNEVKQYIDQHQHLPDVPTETELANKGLDVSTMMRTQMKKIEELTLYLIEKDKELKQLRSRISRLEHKHK